MSWFWSLHTGQAVHVEYPWPGATPGVLGWGEVDQTTEWALFGKVCFWQEVKGREVPHASTHTHCDPRVPAGPG